MVSIYLEIIDCFAFAFAFAQRLQSKIIKLVDVSYGGENGFNQAIELAAESLQNVKFIQEKKLIGRYFDEISQVNWDWYWIFIYFLSFLCITIVNLTAHFDTGHREILFWCWRHIAGTWAWFSGDINLLGEFRHSTLCIEKSCQFIINHCLTSHTRTGKG